jgi:hypothetical protein
MTLSCSDLDKKEEGGFIIVGRAPGMPWWEWVLTEDPSQPFQEVKDPNRRHTPLVFAYRGEAEECLETLNNIKTRRGLMFGYELGVIGLDDISRPVLPEQRPPEYYKEI